MEIVNATMQHLDDVYKLICELESEDLDRDKFSKLYQNNINNSNVHYLLALDGSSIIGFASLHIQQLLHHCAKIGELQEMIVSKSQQGAGIGSVLFNQIKEIAIENDCQQLEVCCNKAREKSHQFYLKQGMKESHFKFTHSIPLASTEKLV